MPELPEVETIKRGLKKSLKGKVIEKVTLRRKNLRIPFPPDFTAKLIGKKIVSIKRRAKYLLIETDKEDCLIIIHLGMSGRLLLKDSYPDKPEKHDHVIIKFTDGNTLIYNDTRRFGLMTLAEKKNIKSHPLFSELGIEPLPEKFNGKILHELIKKKNVPIKNALMDSHLIVGVGNIYACESLFRSHISPLRKAKSITSKQSDLLTKNIKQVLKEAIASGGSSLRDYVHASGEMGYFQHKFSVYGREGKNCPACQGKIKRIKQQGRSTFYCPACQK